MSRAKIVFIAAAVMVILVGYNIFLVEYRKAAERRQEEEAARIEREVLDKIKLLEAREIAEFDLDYRRIKDEFEEEVRELSEKADARLSSIGELKEITVRRVDASQEFRDGLSGMDIPRPLGDYYRLETEFLDSDIGKMALVLEYYESGSYSTYDDEKLAEAYQESERDFLEAEGEMEMVYREYGLEHLLD